MATLRPATVNVVALRVLESGEEASTCCWVLFAKEVSHALHDKSRYQGGESTRTRVGFVDLRTQRSAPKSFCRREFDVDGVFVSVIFVGLG